MWILFGFGLFDERNFVQTDTKFKVMPATKDASQVVKQEHWAAVDGYLADCLLPRDSVLDQVLANSAAAGLPSINVSPLQGKFLMLLARLQGARQILEIGTLGGYSTIWLARALPADGRLITLECESKHAQVARGNIALAGFSDLVELRLAPAVESLAGIVAEKRGPFDFIFIDADKERYPEYLESSLKLARPGTAIVADNMVRKGEIINAKSDDPRVHGARKFLEIAGASPRLDVTAIQTLGIKGYDGFALAVVK
jgi:predicted O-methyltransferase YrrM